MKATALLLVDLQTAYFNNEALQKEQDRLVRQTNRLIALAKEAGMPIFTIRTEHQKDTATWTLNMLDDRQGYLFADEADSQTIAGIETDGTITVIKTRDSAFYETTLLSMLRNHRISTVLICGVSTHTCVMQTAADAYAANLRVVLINDAIASHAPQHDASTFTILSTEYRQKIMTTDELEDKIKNNRQDDA